MLFGYEIVYSEVWLKEIQSEELYGHPVRYSNSELIPIVSMITSLTALSSLMLLLIPC